MRRTLILSFVTVSIIGCGSGTDDTSEALRDIRMVLAQQVDGWNAGSIEAFMEGYAKMDSIRFASGGNVSYGWTNMLERYKRGYPDRASMGTLTFSDMDIHVLDDQRALVFGKWSLEREQDEPWGLFTLLMEKRPEGWRVVHDHTSSGK